MIWDVHTHFSGVEGRTPDERMANLLRIADRMGVERLCTMMGYPFLVDPTPDQLRKQNDEVLQAISHYHDRVFGFVYLSGHHPEVSLKELDRCVKNGPMVGVKLWVARRVNEPELDAILRKATDLGVPILQHTWYKVKGNLAGETNSAELATVAKRHPKATFICGHTGGDWAWGIRAIRDCPNVVADTSGSDPTTGIVEMAVRELGELRVVFGSDAGGRSFASQLAKVQGANVPESSKRLILKENLKRILTPVLQKKGITAN